MVIIWILLLLLIFIAFLLIFVKAKIIISSRIDINEYKVDFFLLYPFIKANVKYENSELVLKIFLFKKSIYKRQMQGLAGISARAQGKAKKSKLSKLDMFRSLSLSDVNVTASYGFYSPFNTGIICGIINIITQYVDIDSFEQSPDFTADDDYIYLYATAYLDIGATILKLIKAYRSNSANKLSFGT